MIYYSPLTKFEILLENLQAKYRKHETQYKRDTKN